MNRIGLRMAFVLALANAGVARPAVNPDEAKQLGTTLTLIGAEKAGNKEGTIPEYTGGLTTPPASFVKGTPVRPNPFKDEKPLFSITAQNVDQYGERVSPGMKEFLKRRPTYRMDVYPTHRTVALPKYVLDNTVANATRSRTGPHGEYLDGAIGGYPFPIPKNGYEAMWNHLTRFTGQSRTIYQQAWSVDASGEAVLAANLETYFDYPYYDPARTKPMSRNDTFWWFHTNYLGPARVAGRQTLFHDDLEENRKAWAYDPGQRRVRLLPDATYDTPIATVGGVEMYDDQDLFTGKMDRFDFKLVGKREMYIPYNNYKALYECKARDLLKYSKQHEVNPDCERWELHRVWVIEATLAKGKRHAYSKRTFFFDEDSWASGLAEAYDSSGKLFKIAVASQAPMYDVPAADMNQAFFYDMATNAFCVWVFNQDGRGIRFHPPRPAREMTPEAIAGRGIR